MADNMVGRTSLADALFSGTRQKVLGLFFVPGSRDFSMKELIDEAEAGSGAVQRELARLVDCGLVQMTQQGRQKRYKANQDAAIYPELVAIVSKLLGPERIIEEALEPLLDRVDLALIYGSVAKRTEHSESDIDLMLVSDNLSLAEVFEALESAERRLARAVNPTLYRWEEFEKRLTSHNPFLRKVLDGPYILLKGIIDESRSTGQSRQSSQTAQRARDR
ncbi:nucleotidyltransferase domain-containing protein [Marinobacter sp. C2H3]|uniref:nucleotidyltransferase domain-containing protein n=1 Tax=Marinobacter sp. C2H3 TaxID=3119003 RepID=UPI00300F0419